MFLRLFIVLLLFPQTNSTVNTDKWFSLSEKNVVIEGDGSKGPYELPDIFILKNTLVVDLDSKQLVPNRDFSLDAKNGIIIFSKSIKENQKINIKYQCFPFAIKKEYKKRDFASFVEGKEITVIKETKDKVENFSRQEGIIIGGSKTFSIGMASGTGFSFDQSLKVDISGEVAKGLSIDGVLSDENTPLEPEGTTETLEQFDRIYVTVKGKNIGATLGDYKLHFSANTVPVIERTLLGVEGNVKVKRFGLDGSFGIPRGKFNTQHIKGVEGKQGPYQLKSAEGDEDIIVVAGTETVYLNGILLKRGLKNDYVIDYNLAQITFTQKRLITDESDIVIQFQYSRLGFQKNLYAAKVDYGVSHLALSSFIIREKDQIGQPEGFELSDNNKKYLSNIGDDITANWIESGMYMGEGKGDYDFVDSFYVYKGYMKGEWNVSFTYIGMGKGDYIYNDSLSGFVFVGKNNGDYTNRIRIPLPEKEDYGGVNVMFTNGQRFKLQSVFFGSIYDKNVLSNIDDMDNQGFFTELNGDITLLQSRWGDISAVTGYHYRDRNFTPLQRIENADFENRWDIERTTGEEKLKKVGLKYTKENLFQMRTGISTLQRKSIKAKLLEGFFSLNKKDLPEIKISTSTLSVNSDTSLWVKKQGANIGYTIWKIRPSVYLQEEMRNELQKKRWREKGGNIVLFTSKKSKISFGYRKRQDAIFNLYNNKYENTSYTKTFDGSFNMEKLNIFRGNLHLTSRKRRFLPHFPGENTDLLLVESTTEVTPFSKRLDVETNYTLTGENAVLFKEVFYEVKTGTGDYSKDPKTGQYYPDTLGNYKRRIEKIEEGNPVTNLNTYLRVHYIPSKFIRCDISASVSEENKSKEKLPIYTLQLSRFLNDTLTLNGRQSLDGEISLYPTKTTVISYLSRFSKGLNNEVVSQGNKTYSDKNEIRIEQKLAVSSRIIIFYSKQRDIKERINSGINGVEKSEKKEIYSPEFVKNVARGFELRLKLVTGNIKITEPLWYNNLGEINIKTDAITPSSEYSIKNTTVINTDFTIMRNRASVNKLQLPADVGTFYPVGINTNWRVSLETSLPGMFTINFSYSGINRPDRKTLHTANVELRADF